ncbi:MAG TPA: hypothetical protein VNZ52_10835, partial [Candidatus Thermoplasmatota archaeon]|nr:hypothetical protein [Candidatus Thermoplasmatota archaeon]
MNGATYTSSVTWTPAGSPYQVTGTVVVRDSATLTIQPGVEVQIHPGATIQVGVSTTSSIRYGRILAEGTEAAPVTFRPLNVTTTSTQPFLTFISYYGNEASGTLRNVTFAQARGNAIYAELTSSSLLVDNVTFQNPAAAGLRLAASSPTVK